jgi:hypothetical protein
MKWDYYYYYYYYYYYGIIITIIINEQVRISKEAVPGYLMKLYRHSPRNTEEYRLNRIFYSSNS